jgi:hypothetical protein
MVAVVRQEVAATGFKSFVVGRIERYVASAGRIRAAFLPRA